MLSYISKGYQINRQTLEENMENRRSTITKSSDGAYENNWCTFLSNPSLQIFFLHFLFSNFLSNGISPYCNILSLGLRIQNAMHKSRTYKDLKCTSTEYWHTPACYSTVAVCVHVPSSTGLLQHRRN
jgi:hypothetical protein